MSPRPIEPSGIKLTFPQLLLPPNPIIQTKPLLKAAKPPAFSAFPAVSTNHASVFQRTIGYLDNISRALLGQFYNLGAWSERSLGPLTMQSGDLIAESSSAAGSAWDARFAPQDFEVWTPFDQEYATENDYEMGSKPKTSLLGRSFSFLGNILDAASGIFSLAQTYKKDVDMGNPNGSLELIKSASSSVIQIGAGSFAGGAAAAGIAGLGAPLLLPVVAGAGAALGAGYLAGKLFDWGWSIFQ